MRALLTGGGGLPGSHLVDHVRDGLTTPRVRTMIACGIILVAALSVLLRLPTTLSGLGAQAKKNDAYGALGRQLAAADSLDIDNGFAVAALQLIPKNATLAVVPPTQAAMKKRAINPLTVQALGGYLQWLLLPRVEVPVASAAYVLCYGCDTRALGHVHWIWSSAGWIAIGRRHP